MVITPFTIRSTWLCGCGELRLVRLIRELCRINHSCRIGSTIINGLFGHEYRTNDDENDIHHGRGPRLRIRAGCCDHDATEHRRSVKEIAGAAEPSARQAKIRGEVNESSSESKPKHDGVYHGNLLLKSCNECAQSIDFFHCHKWEKSNIFRGLEQFVAGQKFCQLMSLKDSFVSNVMQLKRSMAKVDQKIHSPTNEFCFHGCEGRPQGL